jgi:hypothetical protein
VDIPAHIALIAEQLLPKFIPKGENESSLTFQFTIAPNNTYRVNYVKKQVKGQGWEEVAGS